MQLLDGPWCAASGACVCQDMDVDGVYKTARRYASRFRTETNKKPNSPHVTKIIDVVTHSDEQVEEQLSPHLHFHLHGSTTLESFPATDDQSLRYISTDCDFPQKINAPGNERAVCCHCPGCSHRHTEHCAKSFRPRFRSADPACAGRAS